MSRRKAERWGKWKTTSGDIRATRSEESFSSNPEYARRQASTIG